MEIYVNWLDQKLKKVLLDYEFLVSCLFLLKQMGFKRITLEPSTNVGSRYCPIQIFMRVSIKFAEVI
jgi:hypothetical protein